MGALAGGAALVSIYEKHEGAKASKEAIAETRKQNRISQRKADMRAARDRVSLVRKARIARAQIEATAENTGGSGGSGVAGGASSIGSQVASNLGFVNRVGDLNTQITESRDREADALSRAARSEAIGGVADSVFGTAISRVSFGE